jgi:hypothetical protein
MRRRATIEPSIGHLKEERRMQRCRLKGTEGDKVNAVLSAAAMNFSKLLTDLGASLCLFCLLGSWRALPLACRVEPPRRLPGRLFQYRLTTYQGYERIVRLHIKPTLERVKLENITPTHVRGLYRERLGSGLAPAWCNLFTLPFTKRSHRPSPTGSFLAT